MFHICFGLISFIALASKAKSLTHYSRHSSKRYSWIWPSLEYIYICAMVKSRYIGDGHPTFNKNPYNGYINPYGIGLMSLSPIIWKYRELIDPIAHIWKSIYIYSIVNLFSSSNTWAAKFVSTVYGIEIIHTKGGWWFPQSSPMFPKGSPIFPRNPQRFPSYPLPLDTPP